MGLYIPSNPFNSLANNVVPAVVVFSVVLGIALIGVPHKQPLLDVLAVVSAAVSRATNFIVSLTPYGIFAIAAVTSGTLDLVALQRIQVYLLSYIAVSLLLSLWVLPGLVAAVTPVPYRALLSVTRDALIMAFMTGSLFVVLPHADRAHQAAAATTCRRRMRQPRRRPDVIVPASFNFPHTGKLLSLSFVVFAGWFADATLTATDYPRLASTGLLVLFGSMNVAIPFLLDLFHIPADTFQLFLATSVVNARFGTLMSAVHTLTVGVLGTCAVIGCVTFDRRRLVRFGIITMVVTGATVGGTRVLLSTVLAHKSDTGEVLRRMQPLRDRGQARVYRSGEAVPPLPAVTTSVLARIRERGAIRVGYMADSLPYAFVNEQGALVGLDVEMAHQLARDSGVALELVPVDRASLVDGPVVVDVRPGDVGRGADGRSRHARAALGVVPGRDDGVHGARPGPRGVLALGRRARTHDPARGRARRAVLRGQSSRRVAVGDPGVDCQPRRYLQATHATAGRHRRHGRAGIGLHAASPRVPPSSCRSPGRTRCRWRT